MEWRLLEGVDGEDVRLAPAGLATVALGAGQALEEFGALRTHRS
jgi:hypothetical protein